MRFFLFAVPMLLPLAGCSHGFSGTYAGTAANGISTITMQFQPNGKVLVSQMSGVTEGDYSLDGDKITVSANGQNLDLTRNQDGSLGTGAAGVVLRPK